MVFIHFSLVPGRFRLGKNHSSKLDAFPLALYYLCPQNIDI